MGFIMRVGWFGYGGHSWMAEQIREPLLEKGISLVTCHEHPNADVPYSPYKIFDFIDSCDVIYLPCRHKLDHAKSANRLVMSWSRSKPCVVFPLPAYLKHAVDGENCLIVNTVDEAVAALENLKNNPELLKKIALSGKRESQSSFSAVGLVHRFKGEIFKSTCFDNVRLQIIVPHYSPKISCLANCIDSILRSNKPSVVDVHIVSSSEIDPSSDLLSKNLLGNVAGANVRCTHSKKRLSFSQANNIGIKSSIENVTHFLFLNDDTILSKDSLCGYFTVLGDKKILLNPYSNCDRGWLHNDDLLISNNFGSLSLFPGMEEQNVSNFLDVLRVYNPGAGDTNLYEAPFCAMYATLVPNVIVRDVGLLSTEYLNGGEDADFSFRAQKMGYQTYWTKSAFVFHYGGKTRKVSEEEDRNRHIEEDKHNNSILYKKWPNRSKTKRLAIWTGPAWEKWGLDSYLTSGIGGSETCAAKLAMVAAENGYQVTMIGEHETKYDEKISLIDWRAEDFEYEYFDTLVSSRSLSPVDWRLKAKNILVWIHDIWLLSGKEISNYHKSKVNKFICLSPWHKDFVKGHHNLTEEKISIIPNGVNTELFEGLTPDKDFGRLHYSSSPDRGLDNILAIMPWVIDKCPELKLHIFYGFYNWESAARARNNESELQQIENLKSQISQFGERIVSHGRISQPNLAKEWMKAWLWLYPSQFCETFCLTAKEAQISETPILCSDMGALNTTVGDFGIRVLAHPYSKEGRQEFIDHIVKLYSDVDYWHTWKNRSKQGALRISWGDVWSDYWSSLV
jgi:glycosyltransferase involved in cell wall biosynthesis